MSTAALIALTAGAWTSLPPMATARSGHTATLLADGRVLIAGGTNGVETASAEIFDRATNGWSPTGPMATARRGHTATLLEDGTVLVVGGLYKVEGVATYLRSAELYVPRTGTWLPAPALATERAYHSATPLPGGRVLVAGGTNLGDLDSAEIYDAATGTWTAAGKLSVRRYDHAAVAMPDGTVLVLGGYSSKISSTNCTRSVERFDPVARSWFAVGVLLSERAQAGVAPLPDGRVLLAGGQDSMGDLASVEAFDPATNVAELRVPLASPRRAVTATALASGHVVVTGGYAVTVHGNATSATDSLLYDPASGSWRSAGALGHGRAYHTATRLADGRVLIAGGFDDVYLASAEISGSTEAMGSDVTRAQSGSSGCSAAPAQGPGWIAFALLLAVLVRRDSRRMSRRDVCRIDVKPKVP
jgi:hypothetical protein